jgi:hypothetical protein
LELGEWQLDLGFPPETMIELVEMGVDWGESKRKNNAVLLPLILSLLVKGWKTYGGGK